ncbi:shikimate dehydrogenase [Pseudohoeflea suaedae]|uniref:Shikimate dehydrogenase (NADP(+)) n=1 Tax=Pseudohoeflea suaedae TaxID=877384 RepID=A0A4R5PLK2_9HYPH|nr:shikimate dehydrogenase [Pseudohoeflea suaedae]TDH37816.1 shikimate dehydrogenase [Pseudohoeflea suaedae]
MRRAFIIGDPVAHSRSPMIHRYWLEKHAITGAYEPVRVVPEALPAFAAGLKDGEAGFVGGNVTIPHKEAIFALADETEEVAELIGAANTLWLEDGKLKATNTDAYGFAANLDAEAPGWDKGGKAVVLGAGGASRAILFSLIERGFSDIVLVNRTVARAGELAKRFGSDSITAAPLAELGAALVGAGLFVNTSSLGMEGSATPDLDFSVMAKGGLVTDIVYAPLVTPFLRKARSQGLATADGLGMLLHQAVPGFEKWFGTRPEVDAELRAMIVADLEVH